MTHVENARLDRSVVIALCEALGHDASRISSIAMYPDHVSVTYDHFISDQGADADVVGTLATPRTWS